MLYILLNVSNAKFRLSEKFSTWLQQKWKENVRYAHILSKITKTKILPEEASLDYLSYYFIVPEIRIMLAYELLEWTRELKIPISDGCIAAGDNCVLTIKEIKRKDVIIKEVNNYESI